MDQVAPTEPVVATMFRLYVDMNRLMRDRNALLARQPLRAPQRERLRAIDARLVAIVREADALGEEVSRKIDWKRETSD